MNRYIIGILASIGLVILLLVLVFTTGSSPKATSPKTATTLNNYANTSAQVKLVVAGPIVAPQNHNSLDITVSQYSATFNLYQGYDGQVIKTALFNNTENSYKNFLYALYYAGFSRGTSSTYTSNIGLCPTGNRYDFYLINNGKTLEHYWATNCSNVARTYGGDMNLTLTLFEGQIPNISTLYSGANI